MIREKIIQDVNEEFASLKDGLQIYLKPGFDVSHTKQFLQTHVPKEVIYKSKILLDTLVNYLMKDARSKIENTDVTFQNAFYDADFRKRIQEWTKQLGNKLELDPELMNYTSDPRLKQGLIASGTIFVVGSGVTLTLIPSVVGTIVSGLVTILLAAYTFKFAYDKAAPKARELVIKDIDEYLERSKKQVIEWLGKVEEAFESDFNNFCATSGIELKGN